MPKIPEALKPVKGAADFIKREIRDVLELDIAKLGAEVRVSAGNRLAKIVSESSAPVRARTPARPLHIPPMRARAHGPDPLAPYAEVPARKGFITKLRNDMIGRSPVVGKEAVEAAIPAAGVRPIVGRSVPPMRARAHGPDPMSPYAESQVQKARMTKLRNDMLRRSEQAEAAKTAKGKAHGPHSGESPEMASTGSNGKTAGSQHKPGFFYPLAHGIGNALHRAGNYLSEKGFPDTANAYIRPWANALQSESGYRKPLAATLYGAYTGYSLLASGDQPFAIG